MMCTNLTPLMVRVNGMPRSRPNTGGSPATTNDELRRPGCFVIAVSFFTAKAMARMGCGMLDEVGNTANARTLLAPKLRLTDPRYVFGPARP